MTPTETKCSTSLRGTCEGNALSPRQLPAHTVDRRSKPRGARAGIAPFDRRTCCRRPTGSTLPNDNPFLGLHGGTPGYGILASL
mmetsp:Transcript_10588/g.14853  ORF Transcript_10588/g.14853 Transcript_10588/m.14853 type:complete len:84 (-) Transcript_10588:356-607(-)